MRFVTKNMSKSVLIGLTTLVALGLTVSCDPPPDDPPPDGGQPEPDGGPPPPPPPPPDGGPVCGDGNVDPGEDCDDGDAANSDTAPSACRADCTYPGCGDGVIDNILNVYIAVAEECDDGNLEPGDGCSPACQDELLNPLQVPVTGNVYQRDYNNNNAQNNVTVSIINADCPPDDPNGACVSGPSAIDTGAYTIEDVPTNSTVIMDLRYPETYDDGINGPQPVPTGFGTRYKAQTGDGPTTINPYMVKFDNLVQMSVECGVYADLAAAYAEINVAGSDWIQKAAFLGQIKDQQGNGLAANQIPKTRLQVRYGEFINNSVVRNNETYFCWLQEDVANPGKLIGGGAAQNYAGGYFALFKMQNDGGALGNGNAYVGLANDPVGLNVAEQSISVNAGMVGVVTLNVDPDAPPVPVLSSWTNDVYPILYANADCINCHYTGGIGAAGPLALDFAGNPQQVYESITAAGTTCALEPGDYAVCLDNPNYSLLLLKPLVGYDLENGLVNWHPNASWQDENDPNFVTIRTWIEQGAYNDYVQQPYLPHLDVVLAQANARGCNACHDAAGGGAGGLPLDGCLPAFDYAALVPPIEADPNINPNANQDCVHYHLTAETVADDPYGSDYRVNPAADPNQSMLLYNPYCGPNGKCVDPAESHPFEVFPDRTPGADAIYDLFSAWIQAGALNDYEPVQ